MRRQASEISTYALVQVFVNVRRAVDLNDPFVTEARMDVKGLFRVAS
jgi:hypothetical protein